MTGAGLFLTPTKDEQRRILGQLAITHYVKMASEAEQRGERLWRCRPKLHMCHHLALDERPSRQNALAFSCWMDEDNVKRAVRLTKKVHKKTATQSCLQRWQMGLPEVLGPFVL